MPTNAVVVPVDPSPPRPQGALGAPPCRLLLEVDIDVAHLANPVVALSRLLTSEANAHAHVTGDEDHLTVSVALPDPSASSARHAEAWVRWAIHNAGVRGRVRTVEPDPHRSGCP